MSIWEKADRQQLETYFHYPSEVVAIPTNTFYESQKVRGENHKIIGFLPDKSNRITILHFLYIDSDTLVAYDEYEPMSDAGEFPISTEETRALIVILSEYVTSLQELEGGLVFQPLTINDLVNYNFKQSSKVKYFRLTISGREDVHIILRATLFEDGMNLCAFEYTKSKDPNTPAFVQTKVTSQIELSREALIQLCNSLNNCISLILNDDAS